MAKSKIISGIDVGSSKVACIIAKKGLSGNSEIIGLGKVYSDGGMKCCRDRKGYFSGS